MIISIFLLDHRLISYDPIKMNTVHWGSKQTLSFNTNNEPVQISQNKMNNVVNTPITGGRRRITRRKRIVYRGQSRCGMIRSNLSYSRTRNYNISKRSTRNR